MSVASLLYCLTAETSSALHESERCFARFGDENEASPVLVAHEMQHVYDIEDVGAAEQHRRSARRLF